MIHKVITRGLRSRAEWRVCLNFYGEKWHNVNIFRTHYPQAWLYIFSRTRWGYWLWLNHYSKLALAVFMLSGGTIINMKYNGY